RLVQVTVAVGIFILGDARAKGNRLLSGCRRHLAPGVATIAVKKCDARLLGAAPRGHVCGLDQSGTTERQGHGCRSSGQSLLERQSHFFSSTFGSLVWVNEFTDHFIE